MIILLVNFCSLGW